MTQRQGVVLPDRFDVAGLEPGLLQGGQGAAQRGEFTVGEDVLVDELVHLVRRFVPLGAPGDLVVEQPSAVLEQGVQDVRVLARTAPEPTCSAMPMRRSRRTGRP